MTQWNFLQWKFTACRYNLRDRNGFNTFSMSEGLSRDDEEELIRRAGSYEAPSHLPYAPTAEEIRTLFPVRYISFRLRSGKYAVIRTGFVGEDYAGDKRGGNFFSHALIFPDSVMPFAPVLLYNSPLFAAGLSEDELQIKSIPPLLPQVSVTENDLFNFTGELPDFFADSSRKECLYSFIQAVRSEQTGKRVLLRDEPNNVPFWIAAVQLALPLRLACDVSFSTLALEASSARNYHIAAVPMEGSKFALDFSVKSTNFVFDFPNNDTAKIEVPNRMFLDNITTDEMTYPGKVLQTMLPFLNSLDCRNSLDIAVSLYKFVEQNTPLDKQLLEPALKLCESQPSNRCQELLERILSQAPIYPPETLKIVLGTLCRVLNEQTSPQFWNLFYNFLARQFALPVEKYIHTYEQRSDLLGGVVPTTINECEQRFKLIDEALRTPIIRQQFLKIDYLSMIQKTNRKDFAFLYFALVCCLYGDNGTEFTQRIEIRPALQQSEDQKLYEAMFASVVSKAFVSTVHKTLVDWGMRVSGAEHLNDHRAKFDIRKLYIKELKQYGTQNWKNGKNAQPQAVAFIEYLLDARQEERNLWMLGNIRDIFGYSLGDYNQRKNVFETIQGQLHKSYPASIEHFRTMIVGYKTQWERTVIKLKSSWDSTVEFVQDHWIGIAITIVIILLSATCWLYRGDIAGGCKYLWNKLPSLPTTAPEDSKNEDKSSGKDANGNDKPSEPSTPQTGKQTPPASQKTENSPKTTSP
ncbi:hypothetical protein FACS189454_02660 [Planctomycetales bacterium]|nr:hypothetical protein FACS189454_02660 [Planctomycetales bacterium]